MTNPAFELDNERPSSSARNNELPTRSFFSLTYIITKSFLLFFADNDSMLEGRMVGVRGIDYRRHASADIVHQLIHASHDESCKCYILPATIIITFPVRPLCMVWYDEILLPNASPPILDCRFSALRVHTEIRA